jgi:tetratricopeptide (TPR) repeat protein
MSLFEKKEFSQAIDALSRAQKLWNGHDLDWTYGNILIGLAGAYGATGNHSRAIEFADQGIQFFGQLPADERVSAFDHNLGIAFIVRAFALWSTGGIGKAYADLTKAIDLLKPTEDEARLAEAYYKRSACVTRLAAIQATACLDGMYLSASPYTPCLMPLANWLNERWKRQFTQARLTDSLVDANESYRHYQVAGDELGLMQAKAQTVSCYSQAGDRPHAHEAILEAIEIGAKATSTDPRIKALLETLRKHETSLRN